MKESLTVRIDRFLTRLGLGMRAKLIVIFIIIKVLPLLLLAMLAWNQSVRLGDDLLLRTDEIKEKAHSALAKTGEIAVHDAVVALDTRATEDIERMSTDTARHVANFLYKRDADILVAAGMEHSEASFGRYLQSETGLLIKQGEWSISDDGTEWVPAPRPEAPMVTSSIEENDHSFHYRPPDPFDHETRPLYLEMTLIGLDGKEKVKVTTSPLMDSALKDVSDRKNTFCRAETYFAALEDLKPGEIYVSDVIGEYVGSRIIGVFNKPNAAKVGIPFEPENSAYAGRENPLGRRFQGLIRWATPVVKEGKKVGYVTLALDHDHIMEFTAHIMPTSERYTEIPDASKGNYAFIWDYKGRNIVHPRHFSIVGFDAETGDPQIPWLERQVFDNWQASGLPLQEFLADQPTFYQQSNSKKPARELTEKGLVGLDCRFLNFAPQCTGWFDLTREGGSGSFLILWSGLWKLNTAATIPYYTGNYGNSKRGFGFVAIGAGLSDFHRPANETGAILEKLVDETDKELTVLAENTHSAIGKNLLDTATSLSVSSTLMAVLVIFVAIWMASVVTRRITFLVAGISRFQRGERHFRFNSTVKDEMGLLADSFDDMADNITKSEDVPIVITDLNRKILYANEESLSRQGADLPYEELLAKDYYEISMFPQGQEYHPIDALLAGVEAKPYLVEDTGRFYQGVAKYLKGKNGENTGYIISALDVTDILMRQQQIEKERKVLDTIFSSSPDLIWLKDKDNLFVLVNPRFATLANQDSTQFIGKTTGEVFFDSKVEVFEAGDKAAILNQKPYLSEDRVAFGDGHEEILETVRTPIYDAQGAYIGMLGVGRDVSERVNAEATLRATQQKLVETVKIANSASASKSAFLARMSHEIRTPMNAIIGMSNIVMRKLGVSPMPLHEVQSHVQQIEVSSQHLLGLINDILDISKIEAGKIELGEETFALDAFVDALADIIRPRCDEKDIAFTVTKNEISNKVFKSDPLRLRQVLINLLGNAVKFTPEAGSVGLSVSLVDTKDGQSLFHFSVSDSGIGIEPESIEKLFKPFEQANEKISSQFGGTGLGLSISESIIELMGSHIEVESSPGSGSIFSFNLWLEDAEMVGENHEQISTNVSVLKGKRVLIVDDVDINRIIVQEHFANTGIITDEAEDGLDAIEKFKASPLGWYNLILMDVQMPKMGGYEATRNIRILDRKDNDVPIIAMTANAFKEDVDNAIAAGMNAHLAKPLEPEKLMEKLIYFLGRGGKGA